MKLTDFQVEYLCNNFFGSQEHAGALNIGEKLLREGSCIVAGDGNIWVGYMVDNYINKETADDLIGCARLTLDLENFLRNSFVRNHLENHLNELNLKLEHLLNVEGDLINLQEIVEPEVG